MSFDSFSIFPWLIGHRTQILGAAAFGLNIAAAVMGAGFPLTPEMVAAITKGLGGLGAITLGQKINRMLAAGGYGKMPVPVPVVLLMLGLAGTGCGIGGVGIPTDKMQISIEADGLVYVPKRSLGTVPLPQGDLVAVLFELYGAPYLERETSLKNCRFVTAQEPPDPSTIGQIRLSGTVLCRVGPQKTRVREVVTLTLDPVAP